MFRTFKKSLLKVVENRGYCLSFGEPATFDSVISFFNRRARDFFFVQVGAYDGRESDPIYNYVRDYQWRGILVEPQPDAFHSLKENYSQVPGLIFENAAVTNSEVPLPLYRLKDKCAHLFRGDHRTLSSFDPKHILKHLTESTDEVTCLDRIDIPCVSFSALLCKHRVEKIDLLQIDAEGCDLEILRAIEFDKVTPQVIHFEHAHLNTLEKGECIELLTAKKYRLVVGAYDVTAFQSQWMYS